MNISLTNGLGGNKVTAIATDIATYDDALDVIASWKEDNKCNYKVEPYSIMTLFDNSIGIDFGDYSTFILIDDLSEKEMLDIQQQLDKDADMS